MPRRAMSAPQKLPALTEKMVTEQVIGWLKAKGWLCVRLQSGLVDLPGARKMRVGTPGLPDWCCFKDKRYFFLELKRAGKQLSADQIQWFVEVAGRKKLNAIWCDGLGNFLAKFEVEPWSIER
jgi:hypothetical protein